MNIEESDRIRGAAFRRLKDARDALTLVESDLRAIGREMEADGKTIQQMRGHDLDRLSLNEYFGRLWEQVDKHQDLLAEFIAAQAAFDGLDQKGS